ncbi:ROK family protein [Ornithinimicrobium avium]|uniref:ROK family protein n=1 Tax=Ornithinimicrobium avium TaxID=2283195 RepID=A0A345NMH3_9MICO|nr:ROK family protein [Ornithinimicrobium avium]AXH96231.1 ROK family protein [Ornithinimicrobium avium]
MPRTLAVDVGGSKLAAAVVELPEGGGEPVITHRRTVPTPAQDGGPAVLAAVSALAVQVLADAGPGIDAGRDAAAGEQPVTAVGVASAGTVRPGDGTITHATGTLPGWAGTPLGQHLRHRLGLPVTVLNDVHAHGVGEALHGAGRGHRTVLVVAVGTGVGGALVIDGEPVVGTHGVAGHVGHLPVPEAAGMPCTCGREGHLEGFASGHGLRAAHLARTGHDLPAREVAALAASGDDAARALLAEAGRATGRAVGGLLNVLDPDVVVVGGGLAAAPEPWPTALREGVALEAMDPVAATPVLLSGAGADAALVGAARVAQARAHDARVHRIP